MHVFAVKNYVRIYRKLHGENWLEKNKGSTGRALD